MKDPKKRAQAKAYLEARAKANRQQYLAPYKQQYDQLSAEKEAAHEKWIQSYKKGARTSDDEKKTLAAMDRIDNEIADLITDLIRREPSHLSEPWVLWTVISWMRRHDRLDCLKSAFIDQKGRVRPTREQLNLSTRDAILAATVRKIQGENFCTKVAACEELANRQADDDTRNDYLPTWDESNQDQDLEGILRKKMYREKSIRIVRVKKAGMDSRQRASQVKNIGNNGQIPF